MPSIQHATSVGFLSRKSNKTNEKTASLVVSEAPTGAPFPPQRYYGLDALRASMMLLGVIYHLAIPYTGFPAHSYYGTSQRSWVLQIAVVVLHAFRMPTFFLLSGFFSALVWERRGTAGFLRARFERIGFVWLGALVVLSPLVDLASIYNHFANQGSHALAHTWKAITSFRVEADWLHDASLHLWFLEYLMLFCIVAAAILKVLQGRFAMLDRWTGTVLWSRWRTLPLALPTTITLCFVPLALMPYPTSLVPWLGVSLGYGWFFTVGWLIYRRRDLLPALAKRTQIEKIGVPVLLCLECVMLTKRVRLGTATHTDGLDLAISFCGALFIWCTVIALLELFHRVKPKKWLPYLADSSYWIYLMHYPLALIIPAWIGPWHISPLIKVAVATAAILSFLVLIYDWFVRYTVIGRVLNGARVRPSS